MKFSVPALDDYTDLNHSFFVIALRLYSLATNGIVADAHADSDGNNTRFTYAVNNLAHTIFKQINLRLNVLIETFSERYCISLLGSHIQLNLSQ